MGGGGGSWEKGKKKSWRSAKGKQKGLFREAQKGSSLAAHGSLSRTFGVLGVFFNFLGLPKFRRQKLLFFFWKFENSFYFFDSKDSSQSPLFWCFCQKNRVMQKREKVLLEKRKEKEKNQGGT